jgi:hypothetical protein
MPSNRTLRATPSVASFLVSLVLLQVASTLAGTPAHAQESACRSGGCVVEPASGWIRGPEGPVFASYRKLDGVAFLEGDIRVDELGRVGRAALGAGTIQTWPGAAIPYRLGATLGDVASVEHALTHVNAQTVLTLVPHTNESDFIEFIDADGCWSYIGRTGGRQEVSVANGCGFGSAVHEILHAAGVYHEQSRSDRDQYVTIHYEHVQSGFESNFDPFTPGAGVNHGPYDFGSIMHYESWAFSFDGQPTITASVPGVALGQRNGVSPGDVAGVAALYPGASASRRLERNVPEVGLTADFDASLRFHVDVPPGAEDLTFTLSGGTGDADLYVAFGRSPSLGDFDCRPFQSGNEEQCAFPSPSPGTWHLRVHAYESFDGLTLTAGFEGGVARVLRPVAARGLKVKQAGSTRLVLKVDDRDAAPHAAGSSGDPTLHGAQLHIVNPNTGERGTVSLPASSWQRKSDGTLRARGRHCRVTIKPHGRLKVRCTGTLGGFTLDEPSQGSLGVELELGTTAGVCAGFGGSPKRDWGMGFGRNPHTAVFALPAAGRPAGCL